MSSDDVRNQLRQQLLSLHAEMRQFSLDAGIPDESYDLPIKAIDKISLDAMSDEIDFLTSYKKGAYLAGWAFYSQKSPEWWTNLVVIFGNKNLPEQILLRAHQKEMRKAWRQRYGRAKSAIKNEQNSVDTGTLHKSGSDI